VSNIAKVIESVRIERERAQQELARLDEALAALQRLESQRSKDQHARSRPIRKLSAASRRKIAAAQRARWAKLKKQKTAS
jgi:hypothetical protein